MLELRNISKAFEQVNFLSSKRRKKIEVIKNISLIANNKDTVGVVGRNGSGKTTLMKILFGALKPDKGEIYFNGREDEYQKNRKNFSLFNNNERSFFWRLTVRENLEYFSTLSNNNQELDFTEIIQSISLEKLMDKPFYALSSGEKKRAALLRGLLKDPQLLIFDEFTQSLDMNSKKIIQELIKKISGKSECLVFWITHDLEELCKMCNRVIYIDDGEISYMNNDFSGKSDDLEQLKRMLLNE